MMKTTKEIIEEILGLTHFCGCLDDRLKIKWFSEKEIRKAIIDFQSKKRQITDKILIQSELKEYLLRDLGLDK